MPRFDEAALARLRTVLHRRPPVGIDAPDLRRACVLIPLIRTDSGWSILFSRRSENLAAHKGQIAFPGGSVEPGESLEAAAVREAEEEVGIPRSSVTLLGRMDDVVTNSGFLVTPFIGVVEQRIDYVLQEGEVVEVFEVPVADLLDVRYPEVRYLTFRNRRYPVYYYVHGGYEIWGLTGRMLKAFLDFVWQSV